MLESDEIMDCRKKAHAIKPTVYIGKDGLTPAVIEEIKAQIRKNHLIKIKLQRAALEAIGVDEAAEMLVSKLTRSTLIEKKGFCITLYGT